MIPQKDFYNKLDEISRLLQRIGRGGRPSYSDLVPLFDYEESLVTTTTTGVQLFAANANRVAFIISNTVQASVAWISLRGSTQSLRGIVIPAIGSPVEFTVQKYGPIARREWFGSHSGITAGIFFIIEVLYSPELADKYGPADAALFGSSEEQ